MSRGKINILLSPAGWGKTERILNRYAEALHEGGGGVLLLLPTALAVDQVKLRLVAGGALDGLFNPNIVEFYGLVNTIIRHNVRDAREVSPAERHAILHDIINALRSEGKLPHLKSSLRFSGFIGAMGDFITELKQAMIEPDAFLLEAPSRGARQAEIGLVYERYQNFLTTNNLYDSQGKLWRAGGLIRKGETAPFADVREIFVDGFADFTPAEFDILKALGGRCDAMTFALTHEAAPRRRELFAGAQATLELIRDAFHGAATETLPPPDAPGSTAISESALFDDGAQQRTSCPGSVEIIGLPSRTAEVEEIGRRIKSLLVTDNRSPADIAVLVRDLAGYDRLIHEIFTEQGLPFVIKGKRPISRVPGMRPVLQLAELPARRYSREAVCRVVQSIENFSPLFKGIPDPSEALEISARQAGIIRDAESWHSRLGGLITELKERIETDADDFGDNPERLLPLAERAADVAGKLFAAIEGLEQPKTLAEHALGFRETLARLGLPESIEREPRPQDDPAALAALAHAFDSLQNQLAGLARLPGADGPKISYDQFLARFRAILSSTVEWSVGERACSVTVADVSGARSVSYPIVFVAGMNERDFPKTVRQDAFLNDDARREMKHARGPGLPESADERRKEMPLFYSAATRAREKLVLTYPALDSSGREIRRSWYLDEMERVFDNVSTQLVKKRTGAPAIETAVTRREAAAAVVSEIKSGATPSIPAGFCAERIAARIAVCEERDSFRPVGRYDGALDDEDARVILRENLKRTVLSTSRLNAYLKCPFRYFCERVLGISEMPSPTSDTTPRERGSYCHKILRRFYAHRAERDAGATAVTKGNLKQAQEEMLAICAEYFDSLESRGAVRHPRIFALERRRIEKELLVLLKYEAAENEGKSTRPAHFEIGFGFKRPRPDTDPASVTQTLDIDCGEITARFRGSIDRIDITGGGFTVIDYKTGGTQVKQDITSGLEIQLPLYAMAAERLIFDGKLPGEAAYFLSIRRAKKECSLTMSDNKKLLKVAIDAATNSVKQAVPRIAKGCFSPRPGNSCERCALADVCKADKYRIAKKRETQ